MKTKKTTAFILSLIILFFMFPVQSFADSTKTTESGNLTGYNATYRVDTKYRTSAILGQEVVDSRTLYIMGPASTGDYSTGERTPWSKLVTYQNVYITNKIIGSRLLYSTNVSKGVQAYNATYIGDSAFSGNTMI